MPFTPEQRTTHTLVCVAAVLIYTSLFFLSALLPGYMALYRSGLAIAFISLAVVLPCTLLLWQRYNRHYPFMPLGNVTFHYFVPGVVAVLALNIIEQYLGASEPWIDSLTQLSPLARWGLILCGCLIAPVCEEVMYRGFLLNAFLGWGGVAQKLRIVVTSVVFAAMHTQYQDPSTFIGLFSFSALLCVVRINSGSLIVPMLLHMLNNVGALSLIFLA